VQEVKRKDAWTVNDPDKVTITVFNGRREAVKFDVLEGGRLEFKAKAAVIDYAEPEASANRGQPRLRIPVRKSRCAEGEAAQAVSQGVSLQLHRIRPLPAPIQPQVTTPPMR